MKDSTKVSIADGGQTVLTVSEIFLMPVSVFLLIYFVAIEAHSAR